MQQDHGRYPTDPRRNAQASIAGYYYQMQVTVLRWLQLGPDDCLVLEAREDIDLIRDSLKPDDSSATRLEQVKRCAGTITLNHPAVAEALANFLHHGTVQGGVHFRLHTTAKAGREKKLHFPQGHTGIDTWELLRARPSEFDEEERAEALATIAGLFKASTAPKGASKDINDRFERLRAKAALAGDAFYREVVEPFEFACGAGDCQALGKQIEAEVLDNSLGANPQAAAETSDRLLIYIMKRLASSQQVVIKQSDLVVAAGITPRADEAAYLAALKGQIDGLNAHITLAIEDLKKELPELVRPVFAEELGKYLETPLSWGPAERGEEGPAAPERIVLEVASDPKLIKRLVAGQLTSQGLDVAGARKALDAALTAFFQEPSDPEAQVLLLHAALASGDDAKAFKAFAVQDIDFGANPLVRRLTPDELTEVLAEDAERHHAIAHMEASGLLPFVERARASTLSGWLLRSTRFTGSNAAWSRGETPAPLLVRLPHPTGRGDAITGARGVLLDESAWMSLGFLDATDRVLSALRDRGLQVFVLKQTCDYLLCERQKLRGQQMPGYWAKHEALRTALQAAGPKVETPQASGAALESTEGKPAWQDPDVALAANRGAAFLCDEFEQTYGAKAPAFVTTTSGLIAQLQARGLIDPAVAAQAGAGKQPDTESAGPLPGEVVFSFGELLKWWDSGLLPKWLEGSVEWPRIIAGVQAWERLSGLCEDDNRARESLRVAEASCASLEDAVNNEHVGVIDAVPPPTLSIPEEIAKSWYHILTTLTTAQAKGFIVWADDWSTYLLGDRKTILADSPDFRHLEQKLSSAFGAVGVVSTPDILEALKAHPRAEDRWLADLEWKLFGFGFGILDFGLCLPHHLQDYPFRPLTPAVQYERLFGSLRAIIPYFSDTFGSAVARRHAHHALSRAVCGLICTAWRAADGGLPATEAGSFGDALVGIYEQAIPPDMPEHLRYVFWTALLNSVALEPMGDDSRWGALNWLANVASCDARRDCAAPIAAAFQEAFLMTVRSIAPPEYPQEIAEPLLTRQFVPLQRGVLLQHTNRPLRRLIGFLADLPHAGCATKTFSGHDGEGREMQVVVGEEEEETAAAAVLARAIGATDEEPPPVTNVTLSPSGLSFGLVKETADGERVEVHASAGYMELLLRDTESLRKALWEQILALTERSDPCLARDLGELTASVQSTSEEVRSEALHAVTRRYLLSNAFGLELDLPGTLDRFAGAPLAGLDSFLCLEPAGNPGGRELMAGTVTDSKYTSILLWLTREVFESIECNMLNLGGERDETTRCEHMGRLAERAVLAANPFEGLWWFTELLHQSAKKDAVFQAFGNEWTLADWLPAFIEYVVDARPRSDGREATRPRIAPMTYPGSEYSRCELQARAMQVAMAVSASRAHMAELGVVDAPSDEQMTGLFVRCLLLTDRIMEFLYQHPESLDEAPARLQQALARLGAPEGVPEFTDLFNPFLFGPARYNIVQAALLSYLLETWDFYVAAANGGRPVWWSDSMSEKLRELAATQPNEYEEAVASAVAKETPNRLQIVVMKPVGELARGLLARADQG